jgi:hypothetical protein
MRQSDRVETAAGRLRSPACAWKRIRQLQPRVIASSYIVSVASSSQMSAELEQLIADVAAALVGIDRCGVPFKQFQRGVGPYGDNGREAENWSVNLLHPYQGKVGLIGDCLRLQKLGGPERKAAVVIGYEHSPPKIPLSPLIDAFELVATRVAGVRIGPGYRSFAQICIIRFTSNSWSRRGRCCPVPRTAGEPWRRLALCTLTDCRHVADVAKQPVWPHVVA